MKNITQIGNSFICFFEKNNMERAGLLRHNNNNLPGILNLKCEKYQGIAVGKYGDPSVMQWSILDEKDYR